MHGGLPRFLLRRLGFAVLLVFLVSSASLVLTHLAPGDGGAFNTDPAVLAAERHRLGLDRPLPAQYATWLARTVRLDLGESTLYRRPVNALLRERAGYTLWLGLSALLIATLLGIPAGVFTGSRRRSLPAEAASGLSLILLSTPSLVTALGLLFVALRTGWFPAGGIEPVPEGSGAWHAAGLMLRSLVLPSIALALPIAASLERLQSGAIAEALEEPCCLAAIARGVPWRRVVWVHALRLSLKPVLAIYGIIVGSVLSGSFAVEIVMSWPGLGDLMYQALTARDLYLVAGCAATGTVYLAFGILLSDLALAVVDPRVEEGP